MSRINLIIADSDNAYLKSMSSYLIQNCSDKLIVNCFSDKDCFEKYIWENKNIDIVLLTQDMYFETIHQKENITLGILTSGKLKSDLNHLPVVMKYQPGEKIFNAIMNLYSEKNPDIIRKDGFGNKVTQVIATYSPIGGSGKSVVSLGSALQSSKQGKKVLYLNLENTQTTPLYFDCNHKENLSDFIFYIKQRNKSINEKFNNIKVHDEESNIDYLCPPENIQDLFELDKEDINYMLSSLKQLNLYDYIFVDIGSDFNEINKTVLADSDKVFFLLCHDKLSLTKFESFIKYTEITKKFIFILNNYRQEVKVYFKEILDAMNLAIDFYIGRDKTMFIGQGDVKNLTGSNQFSNDVRRILTETLWKE